MFIDNYGTIKVVGKIIDNEIINNYNIIDVNITGKIIGNTKTKYKSLLKNYSNIINEGEIKDYYIENKLFKKDIKKTNSAYQPNPQNPDIYYPDIYYTVAQSKIENKGTIIYTNLKTNINLEEGEFIKNNGSIINTSAGLIEFSNSIISNYYGKIHNKGKIILKNKSYLNNYYVEKVDYDPKIHKDFNKNSFIYQIRLNEDNNKFLNFPLNQNDKLDDSGLTIKNIIINLGRIVIDSSTIENRNIFQNQDANGDKMLGKLEIKSNSKLINNKKLEIGDCVNNGKIINRSIFKCELLINMDEGEFNTLDNNLTYSKVEKVKKPPKPKIMINTLQNFGKINFGKAIIDFYEDKEQKKKKMQLYNYNKDNNSLIICQKEYEKNAYFIKGPYSSYTCSQNKSNINKRIKFLLKKNIIILIKNSLKNIN